MSGSTDATFLRRLATAAAPLSVRLCSAARVLPDGQASGGPGPSTPTRDRSEVQALLLTWSSAVGEGDDAALERRLAAAGWSQDVVARTLGGWEWPADVQLPPWTATVASAVASARGVGAGGTRAEGQPDTHLGAPDPRDPVAFEEILRPFVDVAVHRLRSECGHRYSGLFRPTAQDHLERFLLGRLSQVVDRALHAEFSAYRLSRTTGWQRLLTASAAQPPDGLYRQFAATVLAELPQFLTRYPVAARLLATLTDTWVAAGVELVERLDHDVEALTVTFGDGAPLGPVVAVDPGLSDPHRGGRTVAVLTFDSGVRVVYKPKDLGTEHGFAALVQWCNATGELPQLRSPRMLVRPGYGWVEHLAHEPCADLGAVHRYYQRAGVLLCLLYGLAASDCHRENLVACGEQPVLVDAECLLQHRAVYSAPEGAHQRALDELRHGVLGTGMLPNWLVDGRGDATARDVSALHVPGDEELVERPLRWAGVNTDAMALRPQLHRITGLHHAPWIEAGPADAPPVRLADHGENLLEGFRRCYAFLGRHRAELLAPDGPLGGVLEQRVRVILRNTRVYGDLLHQLSDPVYLRDGVIRSLEIERLARVMNPDDGPPADAAWWPVIDAECSQTEDIDVPLFTARADGTAIEAAGLLVEGCLQSPSAALVTDRIRHLDDLDLQAQCGYIAGALHAESAAHDGGGVTPAVERMPPSATGPAPGAAGLLELVRALADEMSERAVRTTSGQGTLSATWIAPQYIPRIERYQLQPMGFDLHSGSCGPALFLAAADAVTRQDTHRELVLGALEPLHAALDRSPDRLVAALGVGAATGLGSTVYSTALISALTGEKQLLDDAVRLVGLLRPAVIDAAPLDVFEGIAGEILALLAVRELLPDDELLDPAVACGRRLLAEARPASGGGTAWPTVNGRLLTGFSHGAAGIALALARLSAATGERSFHDAAVEAVRYEDSIRDDEVGNWPDLREDDQPAYKANWCHGAPGIGLARLSGRECLDGPEIVHDIDVAVATTRAVALTGPDHLCCGSLGRVEFLLSAGRTRGDADVEAEGRRRLEVIAGRAVAHGGFDLSAVLPGRVYVPGFFMGLSGIGYLLARSLRPDLVPSVLAWDRVPDPLGRPDQPAQDHAGGHHEGTTDRLVAR